MVTERVVGMAEILFMVAFIASLSNGDRVFLISFPMVLISYILYKMYCWKNGHD